jgi:hypothetical protein
VVIVLSGRSIRPAMNQPGTTAATMTIARAMPDQISSCSMMMLPEAGIWAAPCIFMTCN